MDVVNWVIDPIVDAPFMATWSTQDPSYVDYDILGLHKERILTNGELLLVKYWKSKIDGIYQDLAVKEERVYNRDQYGLPTTRDMHITWYLEDWSIGMEKDTVKYYTIQMWYVENKQRRTNLIDDASMYLLSQVWVANAQDFSAAVDVQRNIYIAGAMQPLLDYIAGATQSYMTQTIKDTLTTILTII